MSIAHHACFAAVGTSSVCLSSAWRIVSIGYQGCLCRCTIEDAHTLTPALNSSEHAWPPAWFRIAQSHGRAASMRTVDIDCPALAQRPADPISTGVPIYSFAEFPVLNPLPS